MENVGQTSNQGVRTDISTAPRQTHLCFLFCTLFLFFFTLFFFLFFSLFFSTNFFNSHTHQEVSHKISEQTDTRRGLWNRICDRKHVLHWGAETSGPDISVFPADFRKSNFAEPSKAGDNEIRNFLQIFGMYIFALFRVPREKLRPFY